MKKILGFTGSRKGLSKDQKQGLKETIMNLAPDEIEAHHGLCRGADEEFHNLLVEIFETANRCIVGHPPIDKHNYAHRECDEFRPENDYLSRNQKIVDSASALLACPSSSERRRSGTWSTIRYARQTGKPRFIVWPDGRVERDY